MIAIIEGSGFHMTFENGWTVSVQFRPWNYCDNKDYQQSVVDWRPNPNKYSCNNAEIAAWDKDDNWYNFDNDDTVKGYVSANQIANFIQKISAKPKDNTDV